MVLILISELFNSNIVDLQYSLPYTRMCWNARFVNCKPRYSPCIGADAILTQASDFH